MCGAVNSLTPWPSSFDSSFMFDAPSVVLKSRTPLLCGINSATTLRTTFISDLEVWLSTGWMDNVTISNCQLWTKLILIAKYGLALYLSVQPSIIRVPLKQSDRMAMTFCLMTEYTSTNAVLPTVFAEGRSNEMFFHRSLWTPVSQRHGMGRDHDTWTEQRLYWIRIELRRERAHPTFSPTLLASVAVGLGVMVVFAVFAGSMR